MRLDKYQMCIRDSAHILHDLDLTAAGKNAQADGAAHRDEDVYKRQVPTGSMIPHPHVDPKELEMEVSLV